MLGNKSFLRPFRLSSSFLYILIVCAALTVCSVAQSTSSTSVLSTTATNDPAAVAIVNQAINALGGSSTLAGIDSCTLTGNTTMHSGKTYPTTWSHLGNAYRIQVAGNGGSYYVVSNHGLPVKISANEKTYIGIRSEIEGIAHLPARVLFDHQNDPQMVAKTQLIDAVQDRQPSEENALVVRIVPKNSLRSHLNYEDWLLDPNTHLPISVHYEVKSQAGYGPGTRFAAYYGQYKKVLNASLPMTTTVMMGGHFLHQISIESFVCGQSIEQTSFQP